MNDLVAFIRARLDEDEMTVREADTSPEMVTGIPRSYAEAPIARHIARFADPARVLREVEAGRRVLDRHRPETNLRIRNGKSVTEGFYCPDHHDGRAWPCADVRDLAAAYADHRDYLQEWKPE